MRKFYFYTATCIVLTFIFSFRPTERKDDSFYFIAFGDMPYFLPDDYARFENLIKTVNSLNPVFNIHVGDIKSSSTKCSEEYFGKIYNYFEQFNKPLIYTPGDNEWTDCHKADAGGYDPEERLEVVRKTFFKDDKSFGKEKMTLICQSKNPSYSKFVENRRWTLNNVAFATIHIVGSDNNFLPDSKNFNKEYYEREKANEAWMDEIFAQAKQQNNIGLVIFTQADMFNPDKGDLGFQTLLKQLKKLTTDFGKPVLLINGDSHKFLVDKPFLKDKDSKRVLSNFTRVQVFGESDIHAVRITVNPSATTDLFQIEQILVKGN